MPSPEKSPHISDPATYAEKADKLYFELAKRLRKIGVEPNDLPKEWGAAIEARESVKELSKIYGKEPNSKKKTELANRMRRFATSLRDRISVNAEKAANEFRKKHAELPKVRLTRQETHDIIKEAFDSIPEGVAKKESLQKPGEQTADIAVHDGTSAELHKQLDDLISQAKGKLYPEGDTHTGV